MMHFRKKKTPESRMKRIIWERLQNQSQQLKKKSKNKKIKEI